MKKVLISSLFMVLCFFGVLSVSGKTYAYTNPVNQIYGLGYSVDAGEGTYADPLSVKISAPIFNESWLSSLTLNRIDINQTIPNVISQSTFRDVSMAFSANAGSYWSLSGS